MLTYRVVVMPMPEASPGKAVRFGAFEVDLASGELRKNGTRIRLQEQPFRVLAMLLERPGEMVAREDLHSKLWPDDTFVDFDHGLNTAVNKLREALGDDAANPRFVQTVARRGYRFIAPVQANGNPAAPAAEDTPAPLNPEPGDRCTLGQRPCPLGRKDRLRSRLRRHRRIAVSALFRPQPHSHGISERAGGGTGVSPVQAGWVPHPINCRAFCESLGWGKLQRAPTYRTQPEALLDVPTHRNSRKFPEPPATHPRIYPGTRPTCASSRPRSHPHAAFLLDCDRSLPLQLSGPGSPSRRMNEVLQHYRPRRIARGHLRRPNSRRNLGRKENRSPHYLHQVGFRTRRHPGP